MATSQDEHASAVAHHVAAAPPVAARLLGALWICCAIAAPLLAWKGDTRTGAILAASIGIAFGEHLRGRKVKSRVETVVRVSDAAVAVDIAGARSVSRSRIRAVLRSPASDGAGERLVALDANGIVLDVVGPEGQIGSLERSLPVVRPELPVRLSAVHSTLMLVLTAVVLGATVWPRRFGVGLDVLVTSLVGLWPLAMMLRAGSLVVGVDGFAFRSSIRRTEDFVAFRDVAVLETKGEQLVVTTSTGVKKSWTFEYAGSAAVVQRAWNDHVARRAGRDETVAVRRRVAVDDGMEGTPFRVRVEEPASLAEAVLDSSEEASVRVRAARKLAAEAGDDAAAAWEDAVRRVADPAVRRELEGRRAR